MDFAPEFQQMIMKGQKKATTRILKSHVENGEPDLHRIVDALKEQEEKHHASSKKGVVVSAVSDRHESNPTEVFALIRVTSVESMLFSDLTPEIAAIEQFPSVESLKSCLQTFYPWIQDSDEVHIFHFALI
jgi:hypothetical protein